MAREQLLEEELKTPDAPPPQVEAKPGPGVQSLEALLRGGGVPKHEQVIAILDGHRSERDPLFALLHRSLGNAYVQELARKMDGLRANIGRKEIVAGDPGSTDDGFFIGSAEEKGARWRTTDGRFTGKADQSGLDTTYKVDENDSLHGQVDAKAKTGSLAWERDGKKQGELHGHYGGKDDYEVGLRRDWGLGDGGNLTTGARHRVTKDGGWSGVYGDYKSGDGKTTASGEAGLLDGKLDASGKAAHTFGDGASIAGTGRIRQGAEGLSGGLTGSYKDQATTIDGSVTHEGKSTDASIKGTHQLDADASITGTGKIHHGADGWSGGLTGGYKDKDTTVDGSLTHDAKGTAAEISGTQQLDKDTSISGRGKLQHGADGWGGLIGGTYKDKDTVVDGSLTHDKTGTGAEISGKQQLDADSHIRGTGKIHHGADGWSGGITGAYKDKDTTLDGSLTHDKTGTGAQISGTQQLDKDASISGTGKIHHGADGWTGGLTGSYKDPRTQIDGSLTHDGKRTDASISGTRQLDQDASISGTGKLHHGVDGWGGSISGTYKDPKTQLDGSLSHDAKGTDAAISGTRQLDGGASITGTGKLHHDAQGTTGMIGGSYKDKDTSIDGSFTRRADGSTFDLSGTQQWGDNHSLTGKLSHDRPDGAASQTTLSLSEKYKSDRMLRGWDVSAGVGARDYLSAKGSVDAQLGSRLYGGAWGSMAYEQGKQTTATAGASLTFTPTEKSALTLAGVLDHSGAFEARLQYDVFKQRVRSVSDLSDHKKDALLSLFVSYTGGGGSPGMLNDRYGAPQFGAEKGGRIMGGIRINF